MTAPVDVLAVLRRVSRHVPNEDFVEFDDALHAVAELIEADREVDAVYDEMRWAHLAGPRPHSYGTGWETRDEAARKDRERRYEDAHARRDAALARVGGA